MADKKAEDRKYKVTINRRGEIHVVFTLARGEEGARRNAAARVARYLGMAPRALIREYDGRRDNVKVEEV